MDIELLQLVEDSRLTGYLAVAALCVLIYDHILSFPEEVELIWKSRWGIAKIIYLWNRYFSLVAVSLNMSVTVRDIGSSHAYVFPDSGHWPCLLTVNPWPPKLYQLAASAGLYLDHPDRYRGLCAHAQSLDFIRETKMDDVVVRGHGPEVVSMTIVDLFAFAQMREYVHLGSIIKGCYAYNVPRFLTLYAAVPLLVTFLMFAMTLYKCILTLYRADHRSMPFWRLFLRDGVVWFVLVFAAGGSELIIWTARRETLKQVLVVPALVVYSGVASRSLLNIKQIMAREVDESDAQWVSSSA
ncbi:hypothetical protein C8R46DRAFT_1217039 [Mycena filopes]|nr:hypothetical protein C8R46DRAFT_1217039 [Mycena filopes]